MCIHKQHIFTETDMPGQSLQIGSFEVEPGHMVTYLTLQRGAMSTARPSENVTCRGATSTARCAALSHSFDYISTT